MGDREMHVISPASRLDTNRELTLYAAPNRVSSEPDLCGRGGPEVYNFCSCSHLSRCQAMCLHVTSHTLIVTSVK